MIELARSHFEAGGVNAAGVYYRMILKETSPPKSGLERIAHGEACVWHARKAIAERRFGTATDWYRQAIDADPLAVDYRNEYCVKALIPMDMLKNARIEADRATKIGPDNRDAWTTLGKMEHALGNTEAAIKAYDRAIELAPDDPFARLDRATVALDTADYDTVRKMCSPIRDGKARADATHTLAMVAYREGRHEDAIELYKRAIELGCYDPKLAEWNMSLALHSIGRYAEGWKAHEARGEQVTDAAMALIMNRFRRPLWNGEPAPARIHLHQEMGFGDAIAMARYIPLLIERGYEVCVEVNDSLVELFKRSFPQAEVVAKAKDYPGSLGLKPFDYHLPMLSLPAVFKTEINNVPWSGPFLKPDSQKAAQFDVMLPKGRRIGVCWSSGIRKEATWLAEYGRRKSMSFKTMSGIFNNEDVFVSLQVGPERKDGNIIDILPDKPTWDDTAALVSCLDLVVSVDTSTAHLAGALGKPLIVLMHTEGSWHWMAPRSGAMWNEKSPWYPTAEVIRQSVPHEWGEVIDNATYRLQPGGGVGRGRLIAL